MTMTDSDDRSTSIAAALSRALPDTPRLTRDTAMVALARTYAAILDDAVDRLHDAAEQEEEESRAFGRAVTVIAKIGPRLENTLGLLGMAPGARPARPEGGDVDDASVGALESARADFDGDSAAGVDYAAVVDPSVTEADAED